MAVWVERGAGRSSHFRARMGDICNEHGTGQEGIGRKNNR